MKRCFSISKDVFVLVTAVVLFGCGNDSPPDSSSGGGVGAPQPGQPVSCTCSCTPQGVLMQYCGGNVSNLGDFGNLQKCENSNQRHSQYCGG